MLPYHHIKLTRHEEIYVVPQAKAKHGEILSPIEGQEDLETKLGVSLVEGYEVRTKRLLMHMPDVFPQGVPHVRYRHLVTTHPGYSKADLAQTLWEAGKLVTRHLYMDQRVRFGMRSHDTDKGTFEASMPVMEDHVLFTLHTRMMISTYWRIYTMPYTSRAGGGGVK